MKNFLKNTVISALTVALVVYGSVFAERTIVLPPQAGQAGKFLQTDGVNLSWQTAGGGGGGSVTSVGLTMPNGFTVSNSPITTSGNIAVTTSLNGILRGTGSAFSTVNVDIPLTYNGTNLGVATQQSITSDASGLRLVNDSATPGNNYIYGTNAVGTKAWISQSALVIPINTLADATGNGTTNVGSSTLNWTWNSLGNARGLNITSNNTVTTGTGQSIVAIELDGVHANANVATTGLTIDNQHTGSGSVNVAAKFIAGNGDANYAILANNKVVLGDSNVPTVAPANLLTVGTLGAQGSIGIANNNFNKTVSIGVPTTNFTDWTLTLPADAGTSGYLLSTDGSGVSSWVAPVTPTTPGGLDTYIQFNNSGSFGGSADWTYNDTSKVVTLNNSAGTTSYAGIGSSGAGLILTESANNFSVLVDAGASDPNKFGLFHTITGIQDIAIYNLDYLGGGDDAYVFAEGKIVYNITSSKLFLGDAVAGNQPYIELDNSLGEINIYGLNGGTPLKSMNFAGNVMTWGDVDGVGLGTRIVLDDSTQNVRTENTKLVTLAGAIATPTMQVESTGGSVVIADDVRGLYYDPATSQSTVTITLPATPVDGQEVLVQFGGQVTGGNVVTSLTISPNTGQSLVGNLSTSYADGGSFMVKYRESNTTWYKMNSHTN